MSTKDPLDTEHSDDTEFKEEFDFGESESSDKDFSTSAGATGPGLPGSKKSGLLIVVIAFILFLGYLSYRFLLSPKPSTTAENVQAPKKPTTQANASNSIESAVNAAAIPSPNPNQTTNAANPANPSTATTAPAAPAPAPKPLVVVTPGPAPKNNIEEIQKDLFAETPAKPNPPPAASAPEPSATELAKVAAAQDALKQLNAQMENTVTALKALDGYTHDISNAVAQLNAQISAMDNRLLALSTTTSSLSKDVSTVRGDMGQVKRSLGEEGLDLSTVPRRQHLGDQCPPSVEPEYVLHAVIPGRAWLRSPGGQIITVTEGEVIGSYGKVLVIDASNGIVLTNSGVTFR